MDPQRERGKGNYSAVTSEGNEWKISAWIFPLSSDNIVSDKHAPTYAAVI